MRIGKQRRGVVKGIGLSSKVRILVRAAILIFVVILLMWSQSNLVLVKDYIFTSSRVPKTFVGYNIVNISDIHNTKVSPILAVKSCNPDIIIVSGGLADEEGNFENSITLINKLSNIAPLYYVLGDADSELRVQLLSQINALGSNVRFIEDTFVDIPAPQVDTEEFIERYIGSKIVNDANSGDNDAAEYITYTEDKLSEDADTFIRVSGIGYDVDNVGLIEKVYGIIGTDKSIFQILASNKIGLFDEISKTDTDIVFGGETHGNNLNNYSSGVYAKNGTTLFLSSGIGNLESESSRFLNYPSIISVTLSDGTIKDENPLEKLLSYFISDVKTKFDGDEGFKKYTYKYGYGEQLN